MPQPNKGDRDTMTVRTATEVGQLVRGLAKAHRCSNSDYIAALLAAHVDRPELAPVDLGDVPAGQEALPLTG